MTDVEHVIRAAAEQGLTMTEACSVLGKSTNFIFHHSKKYGITFVKKGQRVAAAKQARDEKRRAVKCLEIYGCSQAEYARISAIPNVVDAFQSARYSAKRRNIDFEISLPEWWGVWETSGQWSKRGRFGDCYVMCREKDSGPYKIGNVFIATSRENIKEYHRDNAGHWGVRFDGARYIARRRIGGKPHYLGSFETEEEARQVYVSAGA